MKVFAVCRERARRQWCPRSHTNDVFLEKRNEFLFADASVKLALSLPENYPKATRKNFLKSNFYYKLEAAEIQNIKKKKVEKLPKEMEIGLDRESRSREKASYKPGLRK